MFHQYSDHVRSKTLCRSPLRYIQSNGYKPIPLDLNHVKLTPNQNTLVERLAENGHNVWARDRVRQGWTYSIVQVTRSRGLVGFTVCFSV